MSTAEFSVVIPAFNAATVVSTAVASAVAGGAAQVIVVDDGSLDDTAGVAQAAGAKVVTQTNQGASVARQNGWPSVTTGFVIFLDADDMIVPKGVRRSIDMLLERDERSCAAGLIRPQSGRSQPIHPQFADFSTSSLLRQGYSPWPPAAMVVRRSALEAASALPVPTLTTRFADDYELLIRLSLVGSVAHHDDVACHYAMSGGKSARHPELVVDCKEQIRAHYSSHLGVSVDLLTTRQRKAAASARRAHAENAAGRPLAAVAASVQAVRNDPRRLTRIFRRIVGS